MLVLARASPLSDALENEGESECENENGNDNESDTILSWTHLLLALSSSSLIPYYGPRTSS